MTYLDPILTALANSGRSAREVSLDAVGHDAAIKNIKRGVDPRGITLLNLCRALGLEFYIGPPRDIAEFPETRGYDPTIDEADYVMVPKLPVHLKAGHVAVAPKQEEPVEHLAFRQKWMRRYLLLPGQVSAIEIAGDSMEPSLADGDTVLVDHLLNEPRQGKIFAIRAEDELLVKRLQKEPGGGWMLTSDNEDYEPIGTGPRFTILGEIVWRGTWLGTKYGAAARDDRCPYCGSIIPYGQDRGQYGECPACVGELQDLMWTAKTRVG